MDMNKYNHQKVEKKWQAFWQKKKVFLAKDNAQKPKEYVLVEFPYPSGEGLHMGHLRPYVAGDVYARFKRMQGKEVMFPIGWDAFGLPAENYAIKKGVQPSVTTAQNIKNAKKQMQSWGLSFDWSREVNTTDPNYYKWTQWLFLQFFKKGLAYEATGLINWCPKDKTGLANEEVIDGKCERCGTVVEKKELRQWYLKITAYAEKLLDGLKTLDWPERVKVQQENWIGKKTGINISYEILGSKRNFVLLHGYNGNSNGVFFPWLRAELLKRQFQNQALDLPHPDNPTEKEQVEFVLKNCKFDENTVLFGHSLGAVVAMKVLEKLNKKIAGLVLAGGFVVPRFKDRKRPYDANFNWHFDFEKIKSNAGFIKIISDPDDFAVPLEQGRILNQKLGGELIEELGKKPHFSNNEEPVLLKNLLPMVTCFTTRPDTNFGSTFAVLGPEHPFLENRNILNLSQEVWQQVQEYKEKSLKTSEEDRIAEGRKKTGVFLGLYVLNRLTGKKLPLYVSDFVLGHVGTGAVVGVPGHDKRDFEFAQVFNLPTVRVVQKDANDNTTITSIDQVQEDEGVMVNSDFLNGLDIHKATQKIMDHMEAEGWGKRVVTYKLRDWVFSRQRYWGEPIPIIHCGNCGNVPVPDKDLPVKLPPVKNYEPTGTGESPLAAVEKWVNVKCPICKSPAKRETNTMPNWAGSSWYWLRYTDPKNKKEFSSLAKQKYWTPVDLYFGGMEHTTLHLLYSRFWNLFLYDLGLVTSREPFKQRKPHGIILASDGEKMSKSRGNVVNPQVIVKSHGADTLRMYELFLGPHEMTVSWNDQGLMGVKRFLDRVWGWVNKVESEKLKVKSDSEKVQKSLHKLIKKITEDLEDQRFNTCISSFMEFHNEVKDEFISIESIKTFLKLLYPFAPHICEELNQQISESANKRISSLQSEQWPVFDPKKVIDETVEIVVQVNGRVKGKVIVPSGSNEDAVKQLGMNLTAVKILLAEQTIKRVIFVPDRLINLVV